MAASLLVPDPPLPITASPSMYCAGCNRCTVSFKGSPSACERKMSHTCFVRAADWFV